MRPLAERFRRLYPDDATKRRQYGLAERIASSKFNCEMNPKHWQLEFDTNLKAIRQFESEYGDRP